MNKRKVLDPSFKKMISKVLDNIKESLYDLYDIATRDEKTETYSHRFFTNIFEMELERAKRGKQNLSLAIIDIDFFKEFNDKYGHLVGDKMLLELSKALSKKLRKYDILSRFGGEEFFVLLPSTNINSAILVAERLRKSPLENKTLKKYGVTISLGVTEYSKGDTIKKIIGRADKALYISKKSGRNKVSSL